MKEKRISRLPKKTKAPPCVTTNGAVSFFTAVSPLQRENNIQYNALSNKFPSVQCKGEVCEKDDWQGKKNDPYFTLSQVEDTVQAEGSPLDGGTRAFMENQFGYDFSKVKIHTDTVSAKSSQSINASAYTVSSNIVFNEGQYSPHTEKGKQLLAHELTHVVQQNSDPTIKGAIQRKSIREEVPHLDSTKDGIYSGSVDRYEYENQAEYKKRLAEKRGNAFYRGNAKVRFDSNNCVLEVPLSVKFLNNDTDGQTHCSSTADKARPLSKADFDRAAKSIMSLVPASVNNWFNIHLDKPNLTGCNASNIPIKVVLTRDETNPDFEITLTENKGRSGVNFKGGGSNSELSGGTMTLCGSARTDDDVIIHEAAHMVLATGDEYSEPGKSKSRERYGEHSRMAQDGSARLLRFHERHFQFATAFMNSVFPGCGASLVSGAKEIKNEITPEASFGLLSTNQGNTVGFVTLGVNLGIPLTKMRELTLSLGPQLGFLGIGNNRAGNETNITALLIGVRAGLKYRKRFGTFDGYPVKAVAGVSGTAGGLWNFADDPGGLPAKTFTPYVEGSAMLGVEIDTQFFAAVEGGKGKILPGGSNSDIDYYKFGLRFGVGF